MKCLVTGGEGLLGRALVRKLKDKHDVSYTSHFTLDLTEMKDCMEIVKDKDWVFHCATVLAGAGGMDRFQTDLITPNVVMNTRILRAAYESGVRKFITFGSSTMYPDIRDTPVTEDMGFEGEPYKKYFSVGNVKRQMETWCKFYSEVIIPRMPCIVLRASNIYGPHDKFSWDRAHVTPSLIRKVVERHDPLEVWGTGQDMRDLIYVDDVADAAILAAEKLYHYDPINIGAGVCWSVDDILDMLLEIEDFYPEIVYNTDKPTMIPFRFIDVTKAKEVLGFEATTSLEDGLRKTIEWYKNEGS